jgi:hypothetical protein
MDISILLVIVGSIFLGIGLIGGGIRVGVKEGEASIPPLNSMSRILASIIGTFFVVFGVSQGIISQSPPQPTETSAGAASQSQINIALTNNHCDAQDFYVDGRLVTSIGANESVVFPANSGQHWVYTCEVSTKKCTQPNQINWTSSTAHLIARGANCPIEITLRNNNCEPQDFYVDNKLMVRSIVPGDTSAFNIIPGNHSAYTCVVNTNTCSKPQDFTWRTRAEHVIGKDANCP